MLDKAIQIALLPVSLPIWAVLVVIQRQVGEVDLDALTIL